MLSIACSEQDKCVHALAGKIARPGAASQEDVGAKSPRHAFVVWRATEKLPLFLKDTCPIHRLGAYLDSQEEGAPLFQGISAADALRTLRAILCALGVEGWDNYRTHDIRRGHALDLQLSGESMGGSWVFTLDATSVQVRPCMRSCKPASGHRRLFSNI